MKFDDGERVQLLFAMQSRVAELRERLKYIIVNTDAYNVTAEQLRQCEAIVEKLKNNFF